MQVTETSSPASSANIASSSRRPIWRRSVNERLDDLKGKVQLRGFRPGKVPVEHLKRLYGKSAMAEVDRSRRARGQ